MEKYSKITEENLVYQDYHGEYKKKFYDIITDDGNELKKCWPNAGFFHCENGATIDGKFVKLFKLSGN